MFLLFLSFLPLIVSLLTLLYLLLCITFLLIVHHIYIIAFMYQLFHDRIRRSNRMFLNFRHCIPSRIMRSTTLTNFKILQRTSMYQTHNGEYISWLVLFVTLKFNFHLTLISILLKLDRRKKRQKNNKLVPSR